MEAYIKWRHQICLELAELKNIPYTEAKAIVWRNNKKITPSWKKDLSPLETAKTLI